MRQLIVVMLVVFIPLATSSCGKSPEEIAAERAAAEEKRQEFEKQMEKRRAEREKKKQEREAKRLAQQQARKAEKARLRSFLTVKYKGVNDRGFIMVELTNTTGKDIDMVGGGKKVEDKDSNYILGSGYTEAVPGDVFIKAGETRDFGFVTLESLKEKTTIPEEELVYSFEARRIVYMDGSHEESLPERFEVPDTRRK